MPQAKSKFQGLLPQRSHGPFHLLSDLQHGCPCLRMLPQQLNVSGRVGLACRFVFGHFSLLGWSALNTMLGQVIKRIVGMTMRSRVQGSTWPSLSTCDTERKWGGNGTKVDKRPPPIMRCNSLPEYLSFRGKQRRPRSYSVLAALPT